MRPTPHHTGGSPGFTLMELMVVLAIIGIMTAMIVPEMRGTYEQALLSSTSRQLANALGIAYSRAVTGQRACRLRIDAAAHRYQTEQRVTGNNFVPVRDLAGGEGALDPRISIQFRKPGDDLADAADAALPQDANGELQPGDSDDAIVFYADGTADAREIQLEDRDGFRLSIRVNPITARVQIKELEHR